MAEMFEANIFSDKKDIEHLEELEKQLIETGKAADKMGDDVSKSILGIVDSESLLAKTVKEEAAAEEARAKKRADNAANFEKQEKDAAKRHDDYLAKLDEEAKKTAEVAKQFLSAQKANQGWLAAIKQTIAGTQVGGKSLAEWSQQFKGFIGRVGEAAMRIPGVSLAIKGIGLAWKAIGIGALTSLLTGLVGAFFKVQSVADKAAQIMAGVSAVISVLANRVVLLGSAVVKVFSGDFSGAAADAGAAVTGVVDAIVDAAAAADNLEKRLQALRDVTISQSVEAARARVEIEKYKNVVGDTTKSIAERSRAAAAAAKLEEEIAKKAFDRALELQLARQEQLLAGVATREEVAQAIEETTKSEIELNNVLFETEQKQREFRKEAAEERKKQQDEEKKRLQDFQKLLDDVNKKADELDAANTFDPIKRVEKEFIIALNGVEDLQKKLLALATSDLERKQIEDAIARLFGEVVQKYNEELSKAKQEIEEIKKGTDPIQPLPIANTIDDDLKFRAAGIIKQLQSAAQEAIEGQQPRSLAEILGLSEKGLEGLKSAGEQVIGLLNEMADARVKEADAAVDAAERRVSAAQDALIREQELAAQGLANDTDLREQELETAKKLREEAEKERAKAVRSQILLDSVSQISSLISASANIFKALSVIPFAGIPLAIATIGVMFGAFAKAKSDALKAAAIPKFRKGGKLKGPAHEFGGIAVSDREGNVYGEAEGGEWIVNRQGSREHDRFLNRLNEGEFAGVDLDRMFRPAASNPLTESAPRIERIEKEFREIRETQHTRALEFAYREAAREIVTAIEEKEVVTPLTNYRVTKKKGRNSYTKVVREEK